MSSTFEATVVIEINADIPTVWKWLTVPELIKKYFFGTQTVTNWQKGSPIFFRGEWEGKHYEDKGTILDIEPEKFVKYNYWSSMSGTEDIPENYAAITYSLSRKENKTMLTVVQDGIKSEQSKEHSQQNWKNVMEGLKKLVEQE